MHEDVGVAADGGREVGVLGKRERVMSPVSRVLHLARAEVARQLAATSAISQHTSNTVNPMNSQGGTGPKGAHNLDAKRHCFLVNSRQAGT